MKLEQGLVNLAWEVVHSKGQGKRIDLAPGSDRQGELNLFWLDNKFQANLVVFSNLHTTYGGYFYPPETTWREETAEFESTKIRAVEEWLKRDWGFELP